MPRQKFTKNANFGEFWKPEACYETQNAKIEKFRCDIFSDFLTLCKIGNIQKWITFRL